MKKITYVLFALLVTLSAVFTNPTSSNASNDYTRLSGSTRLDTALQISKTGWPNGLESTEKSVVLARADDPADALAAASLSGTKDAPILLTYPNKLDNSILSELSRLGAKKIYILGGTGAISNNVENLLKSKGYQTQRVKGSDRFKTAEAINNVAGTSKKPKAIIANGVTVADALSASATSAINEIPIYLATKDSMRVQLPSNIKEVDIFGGTAAISAGIENQLKSKGIKVNRISGKTRYETSVKAATNLKINSNNIILVRGESVNKSKQDYPDAVAASGLANKLNAKVLLIHPTRSQDITKSYLAGKTLNTIVLGGKVAISDAALQGLGYDTPGQLTVHFIDVGQGDSILVQTQGKTLLVDGGNRSAGQKVVSYLKKAGITSIDYLIATHPDADHIGGLIDVLNSFKVGKVLDSGLTHTSQTYFEYLQIIDRKNIPFEVPSVGSNFTLNKEIGFNILNNGNGYNENNDGSVVAKVTYDKVSFLLTGDATIKSEQKMLSRSGNLQATFLKVGHHGSDTSTSQAFLNAVNPKEAILSYGKNSYGHPDSSVVNRLKNKKVKLYSTYQSGDIVVTTDGSTYSINAKPWTGNGNGDTTNPKPTPPSEPATTGKLDITGLDLDKEIVTIKNIDTKDIKMDGWKLVSVVGNQTFKFPSGYVLKKGATVKIVSGRGAVNNPPSQLLWTTGYIWNNSGDTATLYDPQGKKIDTLAK
ncbi:cell wall-binding repeat-containing protein [Bacillus nitroreducens]